MTAPSLDRRQLLIGAGMIAAVVIPAGIYGIPRLVAPPAEAADQLPPLDAGERALVAAMAEGIIPTTDTPGAIGAGVPDFIALLFSEWMMPAEQATFRQGLREFDGAAQSRLGRPFARLDAGQQAHLLQDWDDAVTRARAAGHGDLPAFARFKTLTVIAYYTSKVGQDQELQTRMDAGQAEPGGPVMMPVPFNA
jgi:hypothetical protein